MTENTTSLPRRQVLRAVAVGGAALTLAQGSSALATGAAARAAKGPSRDLPFDGDWRFFLGDVPRGEAPALDDTAWRRLDLPHDWSIEDRPGAPKTTDPWVPPVAQWNPGPHPKGAKAVSPEIPIVMASVPPEAPGGPPHKVGPFDVEASPIGWGTGWTVGGVGWYRKHFALTDLAPGERVEIRFDGAFLVTEAWLNGVPLGKNTNGYMGFAFDLTPHLRADASNVLAVRVSNIGETARWYSGSGLYRHVWLSRTGDVRVPLYGIAITTPVATAASAKVLVGVEVENRGGQAKTVDCHIALRNPAGRNVATIRKPVSVAAGQTGRVDVELTVARPARWSPETPTLHHADITLSTDGKVSDRFSQRFGIRTISVSPKTGFQVNGKTHQLRGVCLHHDNGILGSAAIDRAERRKVELMKANGFNAIRCSHNPQSPHFLDACDELGMIVMDEAFDVWEKTKLLKDAYQVYFADHWRQDLANMVRRDRCRPSIAFWSIGNEIPEAISPRGVELATQMRAVVRGLDTSRFITQALTASFAGKAGEAARAQLDVTSYNYSFKAVTKDHETYPDLTFTTTETHSADSYDIREHMDANPAYMGEFLWTGMDYLGEVGCGSSRLRSDTAPPDTEKKMIFGMDISLLNFYVWDYPAYLAGCGDIDILGRKRPPSYYRDVVWDRSKLELFVQRPVPAGFHESLTPWGWPDEIESWTWPEGNSAAMTVRAYSSGDAVALLLNGREVARKTLVKADKRKAEFSLRYQPGQLVAVAYARGREIARKTLETVGPAATLRLRAERGRVAGAPGDLAYVFAEICDAQGRIVPDAAIPLTFAVQGPARLRAAGSANPYGVESFQDAATRSFHGTALAIVEPRGRRGEASVRVSSPGLKDAAISILLG